PEILIFDEATSALESRAERLVQSAIDNLVQGRTALVIAHRLSTVMRAHKIAVIEQGRKVCEGNHDELLKSCDIYRELYNMQFKA
ncbi:ABC transporter ATP-binding protein, partial [bacterium]